MDQKNLNLAPISGLSWKKAWEEDLVLLVNYISCGNRQPMTNEQLHNLRLALCRHCATHTRLREPSKLVDQAIKEALGIYPPDPLIEI